MSIEKIGRMMTDEEFTRQQFGELLNLGVAIPGWSHIYSDIKTRMEKNSWSQTAILEVELERRRVLLEEAKHLLEAFYCAERYPTLAEHKRYENWKEAVK